MAHPPCIFVYERDRSVLASLDFALALQGFAVADGAAGDADPRGAACLIIEHRLGSGDGLGLLAQLRANGCSAPAILLSTNPSRELRNQIAAAGALLIEKPLLCDELTRAIRTLIQQNKAA
ncbi:response regulator [Altericroceibacterium xinjiangense]|uniref:response regulator n=1 Tax=Altericroceibacterium xinjiangense TaxID=762261 RepID=UPI000F7EDBB5|nr:response regulator [Altericroceibacterium xinjiangense]